MKVITLNKSEFKEHCETLFSKIEFNPDLVVGILNGGGFVLDEFKNRQTEKSVTYKAITLQRLSTKGIKKHIFTKRFLKILPYSVLNKLRVLEHKTNNKIATLESKNKVNFDFCKNSDAQQILVLDDAIDSGRTVQVTIQSLKTYFPNATIKCAVIAWTNSKSTITPDYYNIKNTLVRFPWSLDYKTNRHE